MEQIRISDAEWKIMKNAKLFPPIRSFYRPRIPFCKNIFVFFGYTVLLYHILGI